MAPAEFSCFTATVPAHLWPKQYSPFTSEATSLIEITVFYATTLPVNPVLFRLLRIGKLARAFRMVTMTSVQLRPQLRFGGR